MHTSDTALGKNTSLVRLCGLELEVERRGRGQPLLVLYGEEALELDAPVLVELAKDYELIIPSPPGFGASERPDWIESPDDIAYIYLDLAQSLGLRGCRRSAFHSAAGSRWKWRPRTPASARSWFWSIPMGSRSAAPPIATLWTPGTFIRPRRPASSGLIRKRASAISAPCPSTSSPSSPATTNPLRAFAGTPACTIPSSCGGCIGRGFRRCSCGVSTTASFPPTTARHSAG